MLDDAVKDSRLPRNPVAGVALPRLPATERRYLTHEQVADLADAAGPYGLLGHASAAMTLDRYGHLFGDELDAVADRLDAARAPRVPRTCPEEVVTDLAERRASR